jgi:DNA polymerase-3 subunit gamma/tau
MSYQALARKYRPQRFGDIIGQETVVRTLQNSIEQKRIHHAFLFSGVRGVGKTTAARILAKALNCVKGPTTEPCNECTVCREITEGIDMDVREIDAATYTQVDNIRELREVTQFQPARDRNRIFIIDEAHMLSTGAWNALLKLIEEPPPFVVFILATTEMNKVPPTILSRVQRFVFRKITLEELMARIEEISKAEGIEADRGAIEIIARRGEGSVRDSLSLLDQIIAFSGRSITAADVATVLGLSDTTFFARLMSLVAGGDHAGVLTAIQEASDSGRDFKMLFRDLLNFVRNLLLISGGAPEKILTVSPEDLAILKQSASTFSYSELLRIANLLIRDDDTINRAEHQRLAVEIALLKAATFPRLREVEQALGGAPGPLPAPSKTAKKKSAAEGPSTSLRAGSSASPSSDLAPFLDRVKKARPVVASYIAGARESRKEGNRIVLTFDDKFFAEEVTAARNELEQYASDVFGEPTIINVQSAVAGEAKRPEEKASPLGDDPVVKAFAKHLGGEVVDNKR